MNINSWFIKQGMEIVRKKIMEMLNGTDLFQLDLIKDVTNITIPGIFAFSYNDTLVKASHSE